MYPTVLLHLSPPHTHTTPSLPHLSPIAYAPFATPHSHYLAQAPTHHYLLYIHPTQLPSTPTNPTRPSPISTTLHTLSQPQTHAIPFQWDQLPHLNPTHLPQHNHSTYHRTLQTLTTPTPICPPRRKDSHQS